MSRAFAAGMSRSSEPSAPLSQAENLVTVMGGTGGRAAAGVGDGLPPLAQCSDERLAPEPALLGGSLPPFAR